MILNKQPLVGGINEAGYIGCGI